ncbi:hypothetical protein BDV18DRAFT_164218 [Aspergillus unguis]
MHQELISQLCDLFQNPAFPAQLASIQALDSDKVFLRIDAVLTSDPQSKSNGLHLGCIDLRTGTVVPPPEDTPAGKQPVEIQAEPSPKRLKTACPPTPPKQPPQVQVQQVQQIPDKSTRQVHSDTRFPQRAKPGRDIDPPTLQPTSSDKLISGIWRQVYSSVKLSWDFTAVQPTLDIRSGASSEVFQSVNTLCLKYYNRSQSSRALEMIVQAFWVESFEARTAVLQYEKPILSKTEARMIAIREACVVLGWKEKDLRNRMAIWRGYKEIKDYGGWAALVFASAGVYRFCKYRNEFGEGLFSRLRHIRSGLEVAADTLHPGWRDLLKVIQQDSAPVYHGHPHESVITDGAGPAVPLASTYEHLQLPNGFQYRFVDDCVLDTNIFQTDPRRVPDLNPEICLTCHEVQSDNITVNQCMCFPALFGSNRSPPPVQIFRTTNGKNNGVVARCAFDRGTAIGEFTGLITSNIEGVDVMLGGSKDRPYQIFQGEMGNFTRFINHSCRPNAQFQRFYWRGYERIIVVSRGVAPGSEITVDYSDGYWRRLEKRCLCGEGCCRFDGASHHD